MEVCVQGQWRMALDRERCDVVGPPPVPGWRGPLQEVDLHDKRASFGGLAMTVRYKKPGFVRDVCWTNFLLFSSRHPLAPTPQKARELDAR